MQVYRQVCDDCRGLIQQSPDRLEYHSLMGLALNNLGRKLWRLKRYNESLESLRQALEHTRLVQTRAPHHSFYRTLLNTTYLFLGAVYRDTGRREEWAAMLRQRRDLWPDNQGELLGIACDLAWAKADDEAMRTLEQLVRKGFRDFARLEKEPALTSVRQRPDFFQLIQQKPISK